MVYVDYQNYAEDQYYASIRRINSTHGMETICSTSKNVHKKLILHGVSEVLEVSGVLVLYALWDSAIL